MPFADLKPPIQAEASEERFVVAHHQQCAVVDGESGFQRLEAVEVEMVRRLVQEEERGRLGAPDGAGQSHAQDALKQVGTLNGGERLRELIDHHAVDILQRNVTYCGGYTQARKVAHLAQAYTMPIANGDDWPLFNMHPMAGMMNGWIVEWHPGMVAVGETLFNDAPAPVDGWLDVPDRPGLGLTLEWTPGARPARS